MKRFVTRVAVCGAILFALLVGVNALYVRTDYYINLNGMDKYRHVPEHLDIVSFGSSHAEFGFCWDEVYSNVDAFNMARSAQKLTEDCNWLKYYEGRIDENTTVVLDMLYCSMYRDDYHTKPLYYQILPSRYIQYWNLSDAINHSWFPVLGNKKEGLDAIYSEYLFSEENSASSDSDSDEIPSITNMTEEELVLAGNSRAKYHMSIGPCGRHDDEYSALIEFLDICKEKGCRTVITIAPTLPYYHNSFSQEYLDSFYNDISEVCNEYNVELIDYTRDARFTSNLSLWKDVDHLNEFGGVLFTKTFVEDNPQYFPMLSR